MPNNSFIALGTVGISLVVVYLLLSLLGKKKKINVKNKVVLITGASSGLGEGESTVGHSSYLMFYFNL